MMTEEETTALFYKLRESGSNAVRNKLVENYFYIAEILAKKFSGRGVEYDDLLQVASEALISGVEKFDPDLGNRFTTYVTPTITGAIKNYFRDYSRPIRLPRRIYALSAKIREETNDFFIKNGVKPTIKQLSEKLNLSEEIIMEALESKAPISLDLNVKGKDGENDAPLYEVIADEKDTFERFEDNESLKSEIKKLDPMEQKIVALRYMQGKSQSEAGKILGVSQMFISRTERKIMQKLKEALL